MILSQISLVDCVVFVLFLAPQLLIQVGLLKTLDSLAAIAPFLLITLPYQLLTVDVLTRQSKRPPFHASAPLFTSLVIRCVRYAFANLPATIGAVFFSKPVALPFARWRMLRHRVWPWSYSDRNALPFSARLAGLVGFKQPDCHYEERITPKGLKGVWIVKDPRQPPDVITYYLHGGGFAMGSPWFYLEFLMAWVHLAAAGHDASSSDQTRPFKNPAIFALDYTLVPTATFPTQLQQTLDGYDYVLSELVSTTGTTRIDLAGDSAGATLALSLLLLLGQRAGAAGPLESEAKPQARRLPDFATLVSPWSRLVSPNNRDTPSDYLNAESLHLYARQYVGTSLPIQANVASKPYSTDVHNPLASPGDCEDLNVWAKACPSQGYHIVYGREEVFAPEAKQLIKKLQRAGQRTPATHANHKKPDTLVHVTEKADGIHAWPVVALFLGENREERLKGLRDIASVLRAHCGTL